MHSPMGPLLGVNIDHVATVRQARRENDPDILRAAHEAELGGADIITVHLREDRRHIQDADVHALARFCQARLNLEMGATDEMVGIALALRAQGHAPHMAPQMATLVPESRQELTTEGGLDVAGQFERLKGAVARLKGAPGGMVVSAFIEADARQVQAARDAGFDACEFHTGPYARASARSGGDAQVGDLARELARLADAAHRCRALGMRLHAGHALNYANVRPVAQLPGMAELHIGHAIVARALYVGLREAVAQMKHLLR
jgi:pyridoxine 5-phosphate synthase